MLDTEAMSAPDAANIPHGTAIVPLLRAILCELKIANANLVILANGGTWDPDALREDPSFKQHTVNVA